ncbi:MAG: RNA-binding protein [Cardiobacteriaceae bacterium]|nr:RNA-binding protein [Cardiobacteriaceae bacterium]
MANRNLFQSIKQKLKVTDAYNEAGGCAYTLSPQQQLAQFAVTGCLNSTFYVDAETQLEQVLALAQMVDCEFIAKTAIYARQHGYMKDIPALLLAVLAERDVALCAQAFEYVVDNGKMSRNFAQIIRSGVVGRKSFGSRPKKLIQKWLLHASEKQLLQAAIGNHPSLADIVKMVHPKPRESWRSNWFAWLIGKPFDEKLLPPLTRAFEVYKRTRQGVLPDVPFQMLTSLDLDRAAWTQIALQGSWQQVRQNLNTFARHEVFVDDQIVSQIAMKLSDVETIKREKIFPYQLLTAFQSMTNNMPLAIRMALQDAMEIAVQNVPKIAGNIVVCPDVSGSMHSSVSGYRGSATSKTRCVDVAALIAAAVLRHNPQARVLPFETSVVDVNLNPRDSIMSNAHILASICGGGTACSTPLAQLNAEKASVDLLIMISDNQSWADQQRRTKTGLMAEWEKLQARCPSAQMICLDIQPYPTSQAYNYPNILNIGGFSVQVFHLMSTFSMHNSEPEYWVNSITQISLKVKVAA